MDQSLQQIVKPITKIFSQHHLIIVFLAIAITVGIAIFQLYQVVVISTSSGVDGYTPTSKANAQFDQETIKKIDNLKSATDSEQPLEYSGRQNPFTE